MCTCCVCLEEVGGSDTLRSTHCYPSEKISKLQEEIGAEELDRCIPNEIQSPSQNG